MRTIDSSTSVINPSKLAWWHSSWTGRFVLAALLIAAAAMVLMPDRTSAQATVGITDYCKANAPTDGTNTIDPDNVDVDNGVIPAASYNDNLQAECIALLTAAEDLEDVNDGTPPVNTTEVNWILTGAETLADMDAWTGVTLGAVDHDDDDATPEQQRITAIDLSEDLSGGTINEEWAKLTELTSLNLSGNNLSGAAPRSVWEFFATQFDGDADNDNTADDPEILLNGNPELDPSPPLSLTAAVTKEDDGDTSVELTWDHTEWYTQAENTAVTDPQAIPIVTHSYQYRCPACEETGWQDAMVDYEDTDGMSTTDTDAKDTKVVLQIPNLAAANTYVVEVRATKSTQTDTDENGTFGEAGEAPNVQNSAASQIDLVGPQTVTAENPYDLTVMVTYSSATSGAPDDLGVEVDGVTLKFTPKEASDSVTVTLGAPSDATSGSHTFPVEVLSADSAPKVERRLPHREIVNERRDTRIDLSTYFEGDGLMYEAASSDERVATVKIDEEDGFTLVIDPQRTGRTEITVTVTNAERGQIERKFNVTVVSPNHPPQLVGNIPDLELELNDEGTQVDMSQYFRDLDYEVLRFIPQSANPMVVTASSVGNYVIFNVTGIGTTRMTIIAQDRAGASAFGSFTVTVVDPNDPPMAVGEIPKQQVRLESSGVAINLSQYFTDPMNDPLTYTAESADESLATVEVMEASATIMAVALGETTVTFTATDPGGKYAMQVAEVEVLPANMPPVLVMEIPDVTIQDDDEPLGYDVTMYFSDPEGEELTYVGEGTNDAVAEVRVHSHGLVRVDPKAHGETEVTVTARDPYGASVSDTFIVMVQGNLPPEAIGSIEDQVLLEGRDMLIEVEEYFNDPNGDELTYMATSANPSAVNAISIEGSQQIVIRALSPADSVTITVTAMDPDNESAAQLINVTVIAAAPTPTPTPEPTATPEPTTPPPPTATPAPTPTPEPEDEAGFPVALIIVLLLVLAGIAAAVFIIQRRR